MKTRGLKYNGAYCLTPNLKEFEQAYGKYSDCIAKQAIINHNLQGLLITKGSAGLTWVGASGDVFKSTIHCTRSL